jgi:hypothetical protein
LAARKLEACVNFISSRFTSAPTLRLGILDFTVGAGKESATEHLGRPFIEGNPKDSF